MPLSPPLAEGRTCDLLQAWYDIAVFGKFANLHFVSCLIQLLPVTLVVSGDIFEFVEDSSIVLRLHGSALQNLSAEVYMHLKPMTQSSGYLRM